MSSFYFNLHVYFKFTIVIILPFVSKNSNRINRPYKEMSQIKDYDLFFTRVSHSNVKSRHLYWLSIFLNESYSPVAKFIEPDWGIYLTPA